MLGGVKLPEIEQEALLLSDRERAALAATLIETLPPPVFEISDEEAMRRDAELESGAVKALEHDEFVRRVREARGK